MEFRVVVTALAAILTPVAASAITVTTPAKVVDINDVADHYFDVGLADAAGEQVYDWSYWFKIVPDAGATGSITLSGDWAIEHPANPLVPGMDPQDSEGEFYAAGILFNLSPQTVADEKFLFRALLDIAPGTSGTFQIQVNDVLSTLEGETGSLPAVTWQSGSITVAPEPATFGLLGLGGTLLALRRRRQA